MSCLVAHQTNWTSWGRRISTATTMPLASVIFLVGGRRATTKCRRGVLAATSATARISSTCKIRSSKREINSGLLLFRDQQWAIVVQAEVLGLISAHISPQWREDQPV